MSESPVDVLERHRARIMATDGVHGIAYGLSPTTNEPCILVYGRVDVDVPESIEDVTIEVVPTDAFRAE